MHACTRRKRSNTRHRTNCSWSPRSEQKSVARKHSPVCAMQLLVIILGRKGKTAQKERPYSRAEPDGFSCICRRPYGRHHHRNEARRGATWPIPLGLERQKASATGGRTRSYQSLEGCVHATALLQPAATTRHRHGRSTTPH